jgi:hypothetical protein
LKNISRVFLKTTDVEGSFNQRLLIPANFDPPATGEKATLFIQLGVDRTHKPVFFRKGKPDIRCGAAWRRKIHFVTAVLGFFAIWKFPDSFDDVTAGGGRWQPKVPVDNPIAEEFVLGNDAVFVGGQNEARRDGFIRQARERQAKKQAQESSSHRYFLDAIRSKVK